MDTEEQFETAEGNLKESRYLLSGMERNVDTPWLWPASLPLKDEVPEWPVEACSIRYCVYCMARNVPLEASEMVPDNLHYPGIQMMCADHDRCIMRLHQIFHESGDWPECVYCLFNL